MEKNLVLIVAGEASGDLHASNLVRAIKDIRPDVEFFGLGGTRLKTEGVRLYRDIVALAVVGLFEVLKNLKTFKEIFDGILREVDERKPALAILVDYPGFNLRLAKELKKRGIPIVYYISPQVWAWGKERIKLIRELVDLMIVVFKFEEDLYRENNVNAKFVGHPLLDIVKPSLTRNQLLEKVKLRTGMFTFSLLPGSREKEVKLLLPIMLDAASLIAEQRPDSQFIIVRSPTVKQEIFEHILAKSGLQARIVSGMAYDCLNASDFAIVASGTATLETAIIGTPMVILYKISFLTWAYLKMAVKIPYIGLINVVRREKFIEEFIQYDAEPKKVSMGVLATVNDKSRLGSIRQGLADTASRLGEKGASKRAAELIAGMLK